MTHSRFTRGCWLGWIRLVFEYLYGILLFAMMQQTQRPTFALERTHKVGGRRNGRGEGQVGSGQFWGGLWDEIRLGPGTLDVFGEAGG
jgi:hypothetical protein